VSFEGDMKKKKCKFHDRYVPTICTFKRYVIRKVLLREKNYRYCKIKDHYKLNVDYIGTFKVKSPNLRDHNFE
jgi:hypothetical protein